MLRRARLENKSGDEQDNKGPPSAGTTTRQHRYTSLNSTSRTFSSTAGAQRASDRRAYAQTRARRNPEAMASTMLRRARLEPRAGGAGGAAPRIETHLAHEPRRRPQPRTRRPRRIPAARTTWLIKLLYCETLPSWLPRVRLHKVHTRTKHANVVIIQFISFSYFIGLSLCM